MTKTAKTWVTVAIVLIIIICIWVASSISSKPTTSGNENQEASTTDLVTTGSNVAETVNASSSLEQDAASIDSQLKSLDDDMSTL